jgi:capsular exopolysaccharide synthesis family protein
MSRYFNESRRQTLDRATPATATKQSDLNRVLQEVTESVVIPEVKRETPLSACRKLSLPSGADQPLLLSRSDIPAPAMESYRALRTRLLRLQESKGLRSVILSSAVAREGKTLTSMNLALSCSRLNNYRVLVIDADLRTRGLTRLVGEPEGPGLSEILAGEAEYQDAIMATDSPNLYFLGAGSHSGQAPELYSGNQWRDLMSWCVQNFRLVIVDSPPILPVADFEQIVGCCEGVLIVVRAYQTQRELLKKIAGRIDQKKLIGVILNGIPATDTSEYGKGYSGAYVNAPAAAKRVEQETPADANEVETVG